MLRRQPELARRALAVQLVRERTDNLKPSVESRLETQIRREGRVAEAGLDPSRTRRSDGHCRGRLESIAATSALKLWPHPASGPVSFCLMGRRSFALKLGKLFVSS
jgi:hypothetical protein